PEEIARSEAMGTLMRQGWGQSNPAFRQLFTALFIPESTHEQRDWFNELQRRTVSPENAARLYEAFANIDVSDLMRQVTTPTLVLHARGDQSVPHACSRIIAEGIAESRFVTLESSNHVLLRQEPAFIRFLNEVQQFVAVDRQPAVAAAATSAAADGERKHVTVLSIEIVSPLHAFASADPELVARTLDPLLEMTIGIIE